VERLEPSPDDGVDAARCEARERRRYAHNQDTVEAGRRADRLVVNGVPLADVTRLRRRELLARAMNDCLADAETLNLARKDRS
jgi:hypothetical protein